jgi:nucleotide-binding universal stress UspA family protein
MAMKRHVLVTLDGSPLSEAVLPTVARFAGNETVVTLLSVSDVPSATPGETTKADQPYVIVGSSQPALRAKPVTRYAETKSQALERTEDELKGYLEKQARALRESGIEVHTDVAFGDPKEAIVEYASRPEIDLVAMATHGRSGLRALVFGSVASQVVFSGVRPVMLVRPQDSARGWQEKEDAG